MAVGRRAVLASAAASLAAPGFAPLARADAALPHVTLKLHHAFSSVSCLHTNFLAPWARQVEEQSGGRIRIDIYPSMALGGQPAELFDQVRDRRRRYRLGDAERNAGPLPEDRNCSSCRSCRRAARWSAQRRSRILPPNI